MRRRASTRSGAGRRPQLIPSGTTKAGGSASTRRWSIRLTGPAALPTWNSHLLFTDIEGSTRLLDELGDDYATLLAEHNRVMRSAIAEHRGVVVDAGGDAFFAAFERASDAVSAAVAAQDALAEIGVRVRMGIHSGEPIVADDDYVGMDVHRAARVMAAGHGGQVLLTQPTGDQVEGAVDLRDLGEHRLKDLPLPLRLFQLGTGSSRRCGASTRRGS